MSKEPQLGTCKNGTLEHNGRGKHPHREYIGCRGWQPLPTDRATEPEEPTVEYRVAAESASISDYVMGEHDSLDEAKDHLRRIADIYDPAEITAAWIETRTVTPWTKM